MKMKDIEKIKDHGEATQLAIDWQLWASEQDLSYGELAEWRSYFEKIADIFELVEEYQENGII